MKHAVKVIGAYENQPSASFANFWDEPGKLDRVADSLLGMQQKGAVDWLTIPLRLRATQRREGRHASTPFVLSPALLLRFPPQQHIGEVEMGEGKGGFGFDCFAIVGFRFEIRFGSRRKDTEALGSIS